MQKDGLSDTSAYQRISKKAFDEGYEEGRREALRQQLQRQRETLFDMMLKRYPHLARQTKDFAASIDDPGKLLLLIRRMATIPTVEGAEVLLQIMIEDSKETN